MTRMVEVPEDDLRLLVEHFGSTRQPEQDARDRLEALLPPQRVPVTKNTAWGTRIARANGTRRESLFIAPNPVGDRDFVAVDDAGYLFRGLYDHWIEEPEQGSETDGHGPVRVPVEVGQKRRDPKTKEGCVVVRKRSGPGGLPQALLLYPDEDNVWWPLADVKGWELIQ